MNKPKRYIGDAIYAEIKNEELILTTSDGIRNTNVLIFEPEIWASLVEYVGENLDA